MATQQQIDSTTQQFLDIFDITNDLVILKDGTTSLVITVDAMNFGLLAEEEQDSIMYAYAGLLNSLNYPIQIVIKSQTKDVTGYLHLLKEQEDKATSRLQQQRIMKYREFVSNLIRERNVLDKKFYVAIPAKPLELGLVPISSVVPGQAQTDISTVDKSMVIEKARSILEPKRDHLIAQFARIGLYSRQLETQEIIQLFYQSYNPEAFEGQGMGDSKSYTTPLVTASVESAGAGMNSSVAYQQEEPVTMDQLQTPIVPDFVPEETSVSEPQLVKPSTLQPPAVNPVQETVVPYTSPQPTSYAPTQMTNPVITAEVQTPVVETTTTTSTTPALTTTETQTITPPLPPMPNLPKETVGASTPAVPQEIEIQIDHPDNKNTSSEQLGSTVTDTASAPLVQAEPVLPPLPEIQ